MDPDLLRKATTDPGALKQVVEKYTAARPESPIATFTQDVAIELSRAREPKVASK